MVTNDEVAFIKDRYLYSKPCRQGRLVLRGGRLVDPMNNVDAVSDIAVIKNEIVEVSGDISVEKEDRIINCDGLLIFPGLIDMHLHIHDLFEVSTNPAVCAAEDGVTTGFSPGAGNTFMAPALLGAEIDRGFPLNAGLYLGAHILAGKLNDDELIALFDGTLSTETSMEKLTHNSITNQTAALIIGIKEHMGHCLLNDENIERLYAITSKAQLVFMSHTQNIQHSVMLESLSKGRPLHLGHSNAVGCAGEVEGAEAMKTVLDLCRKTHVTGELVTTLLRGNRGSREGIKIGKKTQQLCFDALSDSIINILVSDGQHQATMKGFGDTGDNIPAILELAEQGILDISASVATMTKNPVSLLAERTGNESFTKYFGHLGKGALANITVVNPIDKSVTYTIVNGRIVSFEGRLVRSGYGAGKYICAKGVVPNFGVGNISMFQQELYEYPNN
jgi:hypothetical protein